LPPEGQFPVLPDWRIVSKSSLEGAGVSNSQTMVHRLQFAGWVPFPVQRVFAFFSNPQNLPCLMPPEAQMRMDRLQLIQPAPLRNGNAVSGEPAAGVGSIITTSFRPFSVLPLRREWIAAITEFEWNHHFADVQQKGPFKRWHHLHEFLPEARNGLGGTLVRDKIEYEVGFGPLDAIANLLFVERKMRHIFAGRQQVLPQLLA
jgi:ligand-binding SRPBCC domain-containing protein